jgi:hypothetical protein
MTTYEAAVVLRCSPRRVLQMLEEGKLKETGRCGRLHVLDDGSVAELSRRMTCTGPETQSDG